MTKRHRLGWFLYIDNICIESVFQILAQDENLAKDIKNQLPDTLLVFSSVKNSPSELSWVLFIVVKSGTLGAQQSALLSIVGDRNHTVAGVDFQAGKEAQFGSHILRPKLI